MAVSTNSIYTQTISQIINRAGRLTSAIKAGETMGAQDFSDFLLAANTMVKHWETMGIHVWAVEEATLFPQPKQYRYAVGGTSTDHIADTTLISSTTLAAAAALNATSLSVGTVTTLTGVAAPTTGDNVGVVQTDGTIFWSTLASPPSGGVYTLATGLSVGANQSAAVYSYTSNIVRPLKVVDGRRSNISSGLDTPLKMYARADYQALPNKTLNGQINFAFYDAQLTTAYLNIWQPLATVTDLFRFTWHRPLHNFDVASNAPDLPDEWIQTLAFNLAWVMAPEYDVPPDRFQMIMAMAAKFLDEVGGFDRENESLMMGVDTSP
jgi:hypothetical protein